jgi:hypothetical protein
MKSYGIAALNTSAALASGKLVILDMWLKPVN